MSLFSMLKHSTLNFIHKYVGGFEINFLRHGHHLRGAPPGIARSLDQRMEEINYKDPELHYRVDIGLPVTKPDANIKQNQLNTFKKIRKNVNMEKESRNQTLKIDLQESNEDWLLTNGPIHIKTIADHYKIFEHLYGDAYFHPVVPMKISFLSPDVKYPVYFGNIIKPSESIAEPEVEYFSESNILWTLILTNLDGHFTDNSKEYVHWFVGNIPEANVSQGETVVDYIQTFPPKGSGYHRFAFVLYKQEQRIDFSAYKIGTGNNYNLKDRTFSTLDFYRERQDDLTPAGLAFFQSHWDESLKNFYHTKLQMKHPIFEYDFDPPYIRPQKWFAKRQPFNLYLDKYRDPKQINKEFLIRKFKNVHPFKHAPPSIPFPNAEPWSKPYIPSWLKLEIIKSRLKWGRVNDIE